MYFRVRQTRDPHTETEITVQARDEGAVLLAPARPAPVLTKRPGGRRALMRHAFAVSDVVAATTSASVWLGLADMSGLTALAVIGGVALGWPALTYALGLQSVDGLRAWAGGVHQAPRLLVAGLVCAWPLAAVLHAIGAGRPAALALAIGGTTAIGSIVLRALMRAIAHRVPPLRQRALIVGSGHVAAQVVSRLRTQDAIGVEPIGLADDEPAHMHDLLPPRLGAIDDLPELIEREALDRVIISFTRAPHDRLLGVIRTCREHGVSVDVVPRLFEFLEGATPVDALRGLPLLSLDAPALSPRAKAAKRALDILVSSLALVVLLPLLAWIALAIKLDSRGPVLFRQRRAGRDGRAFEVLKFRTMRLDAEEVKHELADSNDVRDGVMFKLWKDPRVTRTGLRLRRLSMDELPQLINVLRGEMSLVGPRPLVFEEADSLAEAWQARRLELKPGITGPWQVAGRNHVSFQDMLRLDYQYVTGWSLARDIEILLATIPAVLSRRGAY
jgi:exopolysaccharide biosynthesis polyprenyl glycosylphosphotransferase